MYLGDTPQDHKVHLDVDDLTTHGVVLGRTGSGKTGLTIAILEEAAASGVSAIVLDPKGDLTNLALPLISEQEFAEWSQDPINARLTQGEGLSRSGLGFEEVKRWRQKVDVTIFSPGKLTGGGRPVNVFPSFRIPNRRVMRHQLSRDIAAVLRSLDNKLSQYDPALVFLTEAVVHAWKTGKNLPTSSWPGVLTNPPQALHEFGGMPLESFFPKRERNKLARSLVGFHHQADRWLTGQKLSVESLVSGQKPQIAVFSLRHLAEDQRHFFTALLMNKIVDFMYQTEASQALKLLVALDEARGYLPPYPHNPPTKEPICTILAQGRAQGVGMLIGSQNPVDLDYKALSNVGTWFVGQLRERDCARDLERELSDRGLDASILSDKPQRSFSLLDRRGNHTSFMTRWCYNYLCGPLSGDQLIRLEMPRNDQRRLAKTSNISNSRDQTSSSSQPSIEHKPDKNQIEGHATSKPKRGLLHRIITVVVIAYLVGYFVLGFLEIATVFLSHLQNY